MQHVIAANAETVTISGNHPDVQFLIGQFHASCNSWGATMNCVKSEGIHVVRKPGGATNPGYKDLISAGAIEIRH